MTDPMATTQAPEGDDLLEEARDFAERMTGQPWACEIIEKLVDRVAALSVPVNGQGSGSSADADTHRATGPAVAANGSKWIVVDDKTISTDLHHLNGAQIESMTPWLENGRTVMLVRPGLPDLMISRDESVAIKGGEQFYTTPRGTWGG